MAAVSDQEIKDILLKYRNYTVVGLSPKPERPSFEVSEFMKSKGHQIIGVNPGQTQIAGRPCYPDLRTAEAAHPDFLKMIDVFRSPESIPALVDEILSLKKKPEVLWLQLGITHPAAEAKARAAGIQVVSDRCLVIEWRRLGLP